MLVEVPGKGMQPAGLRLGAGMATSVNAVLNAPEDAVEIVGQSVTTALPTVCPTCGTVWPDAGAMSPSAPLVKIATTPGMPVPMTFSIAPMQSDDSCMFDAS